MICIVVTISCNTTESSPATDEQAGVVVAQPSCGPAAARVRLLHVLRHGQLHHLLAQLTGMLVAVAEHLCHCDACNQDDMHV